MRHDLRIPLRRLASSPAFTAAAVLTLAVGIGASTAIFGVLHSVVLRPLPYPESRRLVALELLWKTGSGESQFPWSYPRYEDVRGLVRSFEAVAAFDARPVTLTGTDRPERLLNEVVTADYFDVLGVRAQTGRTFARAEDDPTNPQAVAVISDGLWRRRFGGEAGVVGATIHLDDRAFTVIGVMPRGFRPMGNGTEIWTPMAMAPVIWGIPDRLTNASVGWLNAMGRLADGITTDAAAAELEALRPELERRHPSPARTQLHPALRSLLDARIDPAVRSSVWILFAAVSLVLLIACANFAMLLLTRAASRRRELAIRRAIGASRGALVRLTLVEALLLALFGGAAALLLAVWGMDLLTSLQQERLRGFWSNYARAVDPDSVRVTGVVLAFDLGVSLLVGMIFGLLPALHATRVEPGDALRSAAPVAPRGLRARGALIVSQMALAMVLVTGAVLVINSFARLLATSVGARSDRLLTFRVDLPRTRYGGERTRTFYDQLVARLDAMPGIDAAAVANALPVSGQMETTVAAPAPEEERDPIGVHMVSARWFEVFGVPLREGRLPTVAEHASVVPVAVLNETAARVFFPAGNAVGSRLRLATGVVREVEIVGIVGDVKYEAIEQPVGPDVYISSALYATESNYVILRTSSTETTLLEPVRRQVQALDPQLALYDVRTMRDRVAGAVSRTRFSALLLGTFATLALALAAVGVYGVVSHQARARTREIAIRMAVGAGAGRVLRGVLADGLVLAVVAVLIGVPAALAATRAVRGLLYGVTPQEPVVLATVAATIVGVALIASWLPARRAARTDPMTVLRHE